MPIGEEMESLLQKWTVGNTKHFCYHACSIAISGQCQPPICKPEMAVELGDYHLGLSENVGLIFPMK